MENQEECLKLSRFLVKNSRFKKKRLFGALTVENLKVLKMLYTLPTKIKMPMIKLNASKMKNQSYMTKSIIFKKIVAA